METLRKDLLYALRMLARNPGFAAIAVLALALGIGANTAIFSVINAVLLKPLPYNNPDQLVKIWGQFEGIGIPGNRNWISAPEFEDIRRMNRSFSRVAAIGDADFNLTGLGQPERLSAATVSPEFFPLLGVQAQIGRVFLPEEGERGKDAVVVLGHGLWQRRFGSDPRIVGSKIEINGHAYTVDGVMPAWFQYPPRVDIWAPEVFTNDELSSRGNHSFEMLARIKPGLSPEQVRSDVDAVGNKIVDQARQYPYRRFNFKVLTSPLLEEYVGDIRTPLWILMGAVGIVLLIACANVANLLLVRASAREREIAVRTALGASRGRLIRQLLTESTLLAFLGGIAGIIFAWWGLRALIAVGQQSFPRLAAAQMDFWVLAFTLLVSIGTGVLFGIVPALQSARAVTHDALKEGGRSGTASAGSQRLRSALVVAEIALSLILLVGAGLLLKSFARLMDVDPGFRPAGVLTMRLALPEQRYAKPEQIRNFYRNVLDRVTKVPGVQSAGAISTLPLTGNNSGTTTVDSRVVSGPDASPEADRRNVLPGFFEAMGVGLIRGRYFDDRDNETTAPVAIIDESMAQTYWPNENPIGQRLKLGGQQSTAPWMRIVGVVNHVHYRTLEAKSRVEVYFPHAQRPYSDMALVIKTAGDALALAPSIQRQVLAVDPDQPVYKVATMQQLMADSVARSRLSMLLLAVFAAAALLLAAVGIYGIVAYTVAQRLHEMGIRMALGASRFDLIRLVLAQSLRTALIGIAVGLVGAAFLTRFLSSLLFSVRAADPVTFTLVALGLVAITLLASYVPARRATSVDPMNALRVE
jgi:putative ABC transport system permease protein